MAHDTVLAPDGAHADRQVADAPKKTTDDSHAARVLARMGDAAQTLNEAQKEAVLRAFGAGWGQHPVNIRLSLPWVGGRFFTTVVAGMERRAPVRRITDRDSHPLRTVGNLFFAIGLGSIFYLGAIIALALQSAIIEL